MLSNARNLTKNHPETQTIFKYIRQKTCDVQNHSVLCCGFENDGYKNNIKNHADDIKLLGTWKPQARNGECGSRIFLTQNIDSPHAVGGDDAEPGEFPYMALLGK